MAILPLRDDIDLKVINFQYVTVGIIITCVAVFLWQLSLGPEQEKAIYQFGTIPAVLFGTVKMPSELAIIPSFLTLFTSVFFHGGWMHLIFNMLFLWVFGDNIEDALGHVRFIAFFLLCGVAGGLFHSIIGPQSLTPTIGASGAIAGVLGGYLVLYPHARLLVLAFGFIPLRLPAVLVIGAFFAQDLLWGITGTAAIQGVAVWAHIGGFIAGAGLVIILKRSHIPLWHRPPGPWN